MAGERRDEVEIWPGWRFQELASAARVLQLLPVSVSTESKRRWSGYVCPDCRFVFRLPRDHDGKGVVCPSCRRMLRIPGEGEETLPLVIPLRQEGQLMTEEEAEREAHEQAEAVEEGVRPEVIKRRRSGKSNEAELMSWERKPRRSSRSSEKSNQQMQRALTGLALVLVLLLVGGGFWAFRGLGGEKKARVTPPAAMEGAGETGAGKLAAKEEPLPEGLDPELTRARLAFAERAEPVVRSFLNATTVDQLLALVRDPERVEPKMRQMYPGGRLEAPGVGEFSPGIFFRGNLSSVPVRTKDFVAKQVALVDTPAGLKVDWESWVGWSDLSWEELLAQKPKEPVMFRVILKMVEYYNFEFSDDREWQSYLLTSGDGAHAVYGYARRDTLLNQQLRPNDPQATPALTLSLRFPDSENPRNQVEILRLIADGWVIEEQETTK